MKKFVALALAFVLGVTLVPLSSQTAQAAPGTLPLLSAGQHYFVWRGLDDWVNLPGGTQTQLNSKYQAAVNAGMDVGFISVDWAQLETSQGVYDQSVLQSRLDEVVALGQKPIVNINTFDSETLVIPDYLLDPGDPDKFRSDIGFADDPEVLDAWKDVLDWAIPMIVNAGGFAISVGNEIDNRWADLYEQYFTQYDTSDSMDPYYGDFEGLRTDSALYADAETPHNVAFIEESRDYIHGISGAADLAVTITVRRTGAKHNSIDSRLFDCINDYIAASDVVLWNYYGQIEDGFSDPLQDYSDDFLVESPTTIPGTLDLLESYSNGKQMMIQEAGYPAGASLNGSELLQKQWFDALYAELETRPDWRVVGVFLMVDPTEDFIDSYIQPIADTVPEPFKTRVLDMFRSFAFNNLSDGSSKQAWAPFLTAVNRVRQTNPALTYTASTGFSGTQGSNGWNYKYWNGSSYANASYNSGGGYWKGSQTYTRIYAGIQTPDTSSEPALTWVAPSSGSVTITTSGNVRKVATGGDGAYARVYKNGTQLWNQLVGANDTTGYAPSLNTTVTAGDTLYFRVGKNSTVTNDSLYFNPVVTFDPAPIAYTASTGFSGTQGFGGWNYKYWNGSSYANASYNSGGSYWQGSQTYTRIYAGIQVPDTSSEPALTWVAPFSGNVIITSNSKVRKVTAGGDGAYAKVYKNGTLLWNQLVAASDTTGYNLNLFTTVSAGDILYFRVGKNSTITNDSLYFDPIVTLQ